MSIIEVKSLYKKYGKNSDIQVVINNVNLCIEEKEFIAVYGESGSGKSTLLHLLAGFIPPSKGDIIINKQCLTKMTESQKAIFRRVNIGFIFQSYNLLPELTAIENVMMPLLINGMGKRAASEVAEKCLYYVGLEDRINHTPEKLSGGQNQRVAIARAISTSPPIILADEPTGNLDSKNKIEVLNLLKKIRDEKHSTIIMVTHSSIDQKYATRTIRVKDGVVN